MINTCIRVGCIKAVAAWLLFGLGLSVLVKLGYWQLSRMAEKKAIAAAWAIEDARAPVPLEDVLSGKVEAKSGMPVIIASETDADTDADYFGLPYGTHIFLLDNQVMQGQVGYRVFRVAKLKSIDSLILIQGEWQLNPHPALARHLLPNWEKGTQTIGYLKFASKPFTLQTTSYETPIQWPLVLHWIDTKAISELLDQPVFPFWIQWEKPQLPAMTPEKHLGYAVQWFIFAGLWIIYWGILFCRRKKAVH